MRILISLSAIIDRYMEMFNVFFTPNVKIDLVDKYDVKMFINDNILPFKKQDRITYLCKMYKCCILEKSHRNGKVGAQFVDQQLKKMGLQRTRSLFDGPARTQNLKDIIENLKHYYSLDLPKINNYVFDKQNIEEVYAHFQRAEDEWKQSLADKGIEEYGKKIITFSDGSAWWDLEREYCKIEGDAMGHCGNTGSPQDGDSVLSYRVPTKEGKWKPLLTFILRKDNTLGEMKGRGNDKPSDKFHPVIMKLLLNDMVKGITGGGYLPENNFSLFDLSANERKSLLRIKPSLANFVDLIEMYRVGDGDAFLQYGIKELERYQKPVRPKGRETTILFSSYNDINDFASEFGLDNLEGQTKDDDDIFEFDGGFDMYQAKNLILNLKDKFPDTYQKLCAKCGTDNITGLINYIESDSDLRSCFVYASNTASNAGANDAKFKAIQDCVKECGLESTPDGYNLWINLLHLCECIKYIQEFNEVALEEWMHQNKSLADYIKYETYDGLKRLGEEFFKDLNIPRYGWEGYDEDVALESLCDQLDELK